MAHALLYLPLILAVCLSLTRADDFTSTLDNLKSINVRQYTSHSKSALHLCCGMVSKHLQECLFEAATKTTISKLIQTKEDETARKKYICIGVTMMTSSRLSEAYSLYSEASTALWASSNSVDDEHDSGKCIEFIVAEIDDGDGNFGTAYTDSSQVKTGRVPHWMKVPLVATLSFVYPIVLYIDADALVVHTHSAHWLHDLIHQNKHYNFVITRDGEGHKELVYNDGSGTGPRLNDAAYVNTGVLLVMNHLNEDLDVHDNVDDRDWIFNMLKSWWRKGYEEQSYLLGRTYDQGALGHLFFTHGTPMRRRPPPPHIKLTPSQQQEIVQEEKDNLRKQLWRSRVNVVEPEVMNNHAPGGSFVHAKSMSDSRRWWCQHFKYPILQLSGQSNQVRLEILLRVWQDGACYKNIQSIEVDASAEVSNACHFLEL